MRLAPEFTWQTDLAIPECKSRLHRAHPLFAAFIEASLAYARQSGRADAAAIAKEATR